MGAKAKISAQRRPIRSCRLVEIKTQLNPRLLIDMRLNTASSPFVGALTLVTPAVSASYSRGETASQSPHNSTYVPSKNPAPAVGTHAPRPTVGWNFIDLGSLAEGWRDLELLMSQPYRRRRTAVDIANKKDGAG